MPDSNYVITTSFTIATHEYSNGNIEVTDVVTEKCIGKSLMMACDILIGRKVAYVDITKDDFKYRMYLPQAKKIKYGSRN